MKRIPGLLLFIFPIMLIHGQQQSQELWFSLSKEQLYLNEKMMKYKENLIIFKEGHQRGFFYFLHPAIPRYKPYLEFSEFEDLVRVDRQLYEKALETSFTSYKLDLPQGFNPKKSYPLFLIFHGGNRNLRKVREHWNEEQLNKQFIKVYLQSYRHFDSESFTWRSGDPRSDNDLREIYEEIRLAYPIDTSRILVSGMSAGATYATGMALRGIIPVSGILAFCPGLPVEMTSNEPFRPASSDIRIYLLGGENDFYRDSQQKLITNFEEMGLIYRYRLVEGMAHQYPFEEARYIREGLDFISNE